jgi:Glycosyltransferase 61
LFETRKGKHVNGELGTRSFRNITLWPLPKGCTHSNLSYFSAPEFGQPFDHLRFRRNMTINTSTYASPPDEEVSARAAGTHVYGGVLSGHFGHFIAESLHRLWPVYTDVKLANAPIVYHSAGRHLKRKADYPSWMRRVFDHVGIDFDRVMVIEDPIEIEHLVVADQGSQLGMGPVSPAYSSIFPPPRPGVPPVAERTGNVYVSRSKYIHSGSYLGEPLIEKYLENTGRFEILHPQEFDIATVVDKFERSETAVFVEGSALHILELCRNPPPNVFIIARRNEVAWKAYFENMVAKKSRRMVIHGVKERLTPLDWLDKREAPSGKNASSVMDLPDLLGAISAFSNVEIARPPEEEVRTAQALSLLQMIIDPRSTNGGTSPEMLGKLLQTLRQQILRLDILPFTIPVSATEAPAPKRPSTVEKQPVPVVAEEKTRKPQRGQVRGTRRERIEARRAKRSARLAAS